MKSAAMFVTPLVALLTVGAAANAQVVINEIFENPQGSGDTDERNEYIELYGRPGMDLTGYMIALAKGGQDENGNDRPDSGGGDDVPEIDEAFSLDGWSIGPDGFFVIYNTNDFDVSDIASNHLTPNPGANLGQPESPTNKYYLDGASFGTLHIPTFDPEEGKLNNDGSSTYVLLRARPNATTTGSGTSGMTTYDPGYAWAKDPNQDVDYDGKFDFGDESPVTPDGAVDPLNDMPLAFQPFQMVDDVAWSNAGGKEYVVDSQQEISETTGFNPDAASRVAYYVENPMRGHRTRDLGGGTFEYLPTRIADESFIYGENNNATLAYITGVDANGWPQTKGPTDLTATPYSTTTCDPEPDDADLMKPVCSTDPLGEFFLDDIDLTGFLMTPADFNDAPALSISQFRFVPGDLDFDGVVTFKDQTIIQNLICATLDDTVQVTEDSRTFDKYVHQGAGFQAALMALEMDMTDGVGGSNSDEVTVSDIAALVALVTVPYPCPGDVSGEGDTNLADFTALANNFGATNCAKRSDGDLTADGAVNLADFTELANNFGCVGP
jgi:hypothetical protein